MDKGFVVDESRLRQDTNAQLELFRFIRKIRTSDIEQYKAVREIFKAASSDYDAGSKEAKQFFYTAQDLFHYATSKKTAAQIKFERCDSTKPFCGLTAFTGAEPTMSEADVAKNYLDEEELQVMENLALQWMLYAESKAMQGQKLTMHELLHRIRQLLEFNGYPVMWAYPTESNPKKAKDKVKEEMQKFKALGGNDKKKKLPPGT